MDTDIQPFEAPQGEPFTASQGNPFTAQVITIATEQTEPQRPPLWKQLAGAGAGMVIALCVYHGYRSAKQVVALLLPAERHAAAEESQVSSVPVAAPATEGVRPKRRLQGLQ